MSSSSDQRSEDGIISNSAQAILSSMKSEISILEELEIKFGSAKNKSQIIHALEHSTILHRIPLPMPNATTEQARKDFRRERVLLNEVPFIPDKVDVDRCNAFSMTLQLLLERMARIPDSFDKELYPDSEALTDAVMQRACRTGAGADSFFMVQKLLCVEGTFVTQRTFMNDSPIKIDVFVCSEPPPRPTDLAEPPQPSAKKGSSLFGAYRSNNSLHSASSGIALAHSASTDHADTLRAAEAAPSPRSVYGNGQDNGNVTPPSTPPIGRGASAGASASGSKADRHMRPAGQRVHHIGIPSPLKVSLRNMGIISGGAGGSNSSSKAPKPFPMQGATPPTQQQQQRESAQSDPAPVSPSLMQPSLAFTPPSTPSGATAAGTGTGTVGASFSFSSSGSADDSGVLMDNHSSHYCGGSVDNGGGPRLGIAQPAEDPDTISVTSAPFGLAQTGTVRGEGSDPNMICARVQVMNSFAIYDVAAIEEITGVAGQDPDPWLEVEAVVVDESNFSNNQHSRKLQLIVTCPGTGKIYTSAPDPSSSGRHSGRLSGRRVLQELTSWLTHLPQHHIHLPLHWRHHLPGKGQDRGLPSSASDSALDSTPAGGLSHAPGTPTRSAPEFASLLAKGEAPLPARPLDLSLSVPQSSSGSASQSNSHSKSNSVENGPVATDSSLSSASHDYSPLLALDERGEGSSKAMATSHEAEGTVGVPTQAQHIRRFSGVKDGVARGALHDAAVAALLEPSPMSSGISRHSFHLPSETQQQQQLQEQQERRGADFVEAERGCGSGNVTDSDTDAGGAEDRGARGSSCDAVSSGSSGTEYGTGTGTVGTGGANRSSFPVRTHEELDLLIPSLRLMGGRGAGDSSSSSDSDADRPPPVQPS